MSQHLFLRLGIHMRRPCTELPGPHWLGKALGPRLYPGNSVLIEGRETNRHICKSLDKMEANLCWAVCGEIHARKYNVRILEAVSWGVKSGLPYTLLYGVEQDLDRDQLLDHTACRYMDKRTEFSPIA